MAKKKLHIVNERMLLLMKWSIDRRIASSEADFFNQIGLKPTNAYNVKTGNLSFSNDHIIAAAKLTGGNINWIFGVEKTMLRKDERTPLERLKQATVELQAQMKRST
jgi:hypothetical protein